MQEVSGSRFSYCGGVEAFRSGEVHTSWASVHFALMVGKAAIGGMQSDVAGASVA